MAVTDQHSRNVAYRLGDRTFTATDLHELCGDASAFRESIDEEAAGGRTVDGHD